MDLRLRGLGSSLWHRAADTKNAFRFPRQEIGQGFELRELDYIPWPSSPPFETARLGRIFSAKEPVVFDQVGIEFSDEFFKNWNTLVFAITFQRLGGFFVKERWFLIQVGIKFSDEF